MIDYDKHNWFDHLFDIDGSMVREIIGRVIACAVWTVGVVALHQYVCNLSIEPTLHTIVGLALGLLLVFRTNASYDRYWEGRRQWGAIVNESRNLVRGVRAFAPEDRALGRTVAVWTTAFTHSVMYHLRGEPGLGPAARLLPRAEADEAARAQHVPLGIALRISRMLAEARDAGRFSDFVMVSLDQNVQLLIDYVGACERIHKTPLPFVYVVHLRRALIVYCFTLPFALVKPFGWWAILATWLVAYTFFGIEEIGVEIEDPFGHDSNDLPLEQICATIEGNILALVDEPARAPAAPAPHVTPDGPPAETFEGVGS